MDTHVCTFDKNRIYCNIYTRSALPEKHTKMCNVRDTWQHDQLVLLLCTMNEWVSCDWNLCEPMLFYIHNNSGLNSMC